MALSSVIAALDLLDAATASGAVVADAARARGIEQIERSDHGRQRHGEPLRRRA